MGVREKKEEEVLSEWTRTNTVSLPSGDGGGSSGGTPSLAPTKTDATPRLERQLDSDAVVAVMAVLGSLICLLLILACIFVFCLRCPFLPENDFSVATTRRNRRRS